MSDTPTTFSEWIDSRPGREDGFEMVDAWEAGESAGEAKGRAALMAELASLRKRLAEAEREWVELKSALAAMASKRTDATRLLPLGGAEWRAIRNHLAAWRADEISEGRLRELVAEVLGDTTGEDNDEAIQELAAFHGIEDPDLPPREAVQKAVEAFQTPKPPDVDALAEFIRTLRVYGAGFHALSPRTLAERIVEWWVGR